MKKGIAIIKLSKPLSVKRIRIGKWNKKRNNSTKILKL